MAIIGNYQVPAEVMVNIFEYLPPEENTQNAKVCRSWRGFAEDVAKKQIIVRTQQEILRKTANFLRMVVPRQLGEYCPTFQRLTDLIRDRQGREGYSFNQIHQMTLSATEKQTICMAYFYRIDPTDPNIPADRPTELAGRVFVELHFEQDNQPRLWHPSNNGPYDPVAFLPIELFNLTVNGPNFAIAGEKDQGTICFAFRGRLIELRLEQGNDRVRTAIWTGIHGANRDTATTWPLTAANADTGWTWAKDFYIAHLDAAPAP